MLRPGINDGLFYKQQQLHKHKLHITQFKVSLQVASITETNKPQIHKSEFCLHLGKIIIIFPCSG